MPAAATSSRIHTMNIAHLQTIATQTTTPDWVVSPKGHQGLELQAPLNPPGRWTHFKAALSKLPLLGQLGSLQEARQKVESFSARQLQFQATNRQILVDLRRELHAAYGSHAADMAMSNVTATDGAPLTQRMVKAAIDTGERHLSSWRSLNNRTLTLFLESSMQGRTLGGGQQDMNDVFLLRKLPMAGAASWDHTLGNDSARFISLLVQGKVRAMPEHSREPIGNDQMVKAAEEALDIYQGLRETPGLSTQSLEQVLANAIGNGKHTPQALIDRARERVVADPLEQQLDRKNPDSWIRQLANDVTQDMRDTILALKLPEPGLNLGPVLKCISNSVDETVRFNIRSLPGELGCGTSTKDMASALRTKLATLIPQAIREHIQALALIQASDTLSDAGKSNLLAVANERRLDSVQVAQYQHNASALSAARNALQAFARDLSDSEALHGQLGNALTAFEDGLQTMKEHGATLWESGSLSGGDMTYTLMDQFARLSACELSDEQAKALLTELTGKAVAEQLRTMRDSDDSRIAAQLPIVLLSVVRGVAERAGHTESEIQELVEDLSSKD
jgi:hypothetical protein